MGKSHSKVLIAFAFLEAALKLMTQAADNCSNSDQTCEATTRNKHCENAQLFDSDTCQLDQNVFTRIISNAKKYGEDRILIFAAIDAPPRAGKSMALYHTIGCGADGFPGRCQVNHVTRGVWVHEHPLTCCALAYIHNISNNNCPCECKGDPNNPADNTCPLISFLDIEGGIAGGG